MLHHIVWWTLKKEADGFSAAENARRLKEAAHILHAIPTVLSVEVSYEIAPSTTVPATFVLQSVHNDAAGLKAYAAHPIQGNFGKLIAATCEGRQALDYTVE